MTHVAVAKDSPLYIGVSAGQSTVNSDVNGTYSASTNASITAGLIISDTAALQSIIEATYTRSIEKESATVNNTANEYKEETLGAYLAARTNTDVYGKAKIGLVRHKITTDTEVTYDKSRLSAGVGFGVKLESGTTEVEYIVYDDDISLLKIGYLYSFR